MKLNSKSEKISWHLKKFWMFILMGGILSLFSSIISIIIDLLECQGYSNCFHGFLGGEWYIEADPFFPFFLRIPLTFDISGLPNILYLSINSILILIPLTLLLSLLPDTNIYENLDIKVRYLILPIILLGLDLIFFERRFYYILEGFFRTGLDYIWDIWFVFAIFGVFIGNIIIIIGYFYRRKLINTLLRLKQ